MTISATAFQDWLAEYQQQIFPLYDDENFDAYDESYDMHLRGLHELIRNQAPLLDAAGELLQFVQEVASYNCCCDRQPAGLKCWQCRAKELVAKAKGTQ